MIKILIDQLVWCGTYRAMAGKQCRQPREFKIAAKRSKVIDHITLGGRDDHRTVSNDTITREE